MQTASKPFDFFQNEGVNDEKRADSVSKLSKECYRTFIDHKINSDMFQAKERFDCKQ